MSDDDVRAALSAYAAEVLVLRFDGELPGPEAGPGDLLSTLLDVRRRLDRIEELHARAIRIKGQVHRKAAFATAVADDAWDTAAQSRRTAPVIRGDEYSSARERTAEANLATVNERVAARKASALATDCDVFVDVIRLAHRGLDGTRHDLLAMLRTLQFETVLER